MRNLFGLVCLLLVGCSFNAGLAFQPPALAQSPAQPTQLPVRQVECKYIPPALPEVPQVPIDRISKINPSAKSEVKQALLDHIREMHAYLYVINGLHKEAYLKYARCN